MPDKDDEMSYKTLPKYFCQHGGKCNQGQYNPDNSWCKACKQYSRIGNNPINPPQQEAPNEQA